MSNKYSSYNGFNLVELAIIITIISLLITSISAGRSIIHNSRLTNIMKNFNSYMAAIHNFKLEYNALPGDISNAYNFFGIDCDVKPEFCNGNGDGLITANTDNNDDETNRFWQHLYLSGYLTEYSTGKGGKALSSPKGPIEGSSFIMEAYKFYDFKGKITVTNNLTFSYLYDFQGILAVQDAQNIDIKMDDGKAYSGNILAADGNQYPNGTCTGSYITDDESDYILTSTIPGCLLAYPYEFQN